MITGSLLDMKRSRTDLIAENALLRQQLIVLNRQVKKPQLTNHDRVRLVLLSRFTQHSKQAIHLVQPETILRWHRELVRRKWTFRRKSNPGRPKLSSELEALIVRLTKENPHWGYGKIQGELLKLGYKLCASSVHNILMRHRVSPAPERSSGSWRSFLGHYKDQILACDFFTVETIWLKTIYVLFFIELGTRRVHLAGCTTQPDTTWVTQQARKTGLEPEG